VQRTCTGAAAREGDEPPVIGGDRTARVSGRDVGVHLVLVSFLAGMGGPS
jgi:hypothetical protein